MTGKSISSLKHKAFKTKELGYEPAKGMGGLGQGYAGRGGQVEKWVRLEHTLSCRPQGIPEKVKRTKVK